MHSILDRVAKRIGDRITPATQEGFEHWDLTNAGSRRAIGVGGHAYLLDEVHVGWRISQYRKDRRPDPNSCSFIWESQSLEELWSMVQTLESQSSRMVALVARRGHAQMVTDLDGGFRVVASTNGFDFEAVLYDGSGRQIGDYCGFLNTPQPTFILGQDTIQGSQNLDDQYRGQGFGARLVDAAEELMGLSAVPHGYLFTPGTTTKEADRFWAKRADAGRVPGLPLSNEILARFEQVSLFDERIRQGFDHVELGVEAALTQGYDLCVAEDGDRACFAWPVANDGRHISRTGYADSRRIVEANVNTKNAALLPTRIVPCSDIQMTLPIRSAAIYTGPSKP